MKKILFVAGITVVGLSAAFAQEVKQAPQRVTQNTVAPRSAQMMKVSAEEMAQKRTNRLDQELKLNADQKKKVYDLFLKESNEHRGRVSANGGQMDEHLKGILTAEQNQQYETIKNERQQRMRERVSIKRSGVKASPSVK